jgi:hypothetical protein
LVILRCPNAKDRSKRTFCAFPDVENSRIKKSLSIKSLANPGVIPADVSDLDATRGNDFYAVGIVAVLGITN